MVNVLASIALIAIVMVFGFILTGLILVILIEKVFCNYSVSVAMGYIWANSEKPDAVDESVARRAVALNIQCRVLLTLIAGLFIGGTALMLGTIISASTIRAAVWLAGMTAFIRTGTLAIGEFHYWPEIVHCERVEMTWTSERPSEPWCDVYFRKVIIDDGGDVDMTLRLDNIHENGFATPTKGETYIIMTPPVGEMVCVSLHI